MFSSRSLVSGAKEEANNSSFRLEFEQMKARYAQFMEEHGDEMKNFYSDWDVNAVKGLLQTGRYSKYTDEILDELIGNETLSKTSEGSTTYLNMHSKLGSISMDSVYLGHHEPPRKNVVGVVAPPCAGKSTTVDRNTHFRNLLVLDGSWLIGMASRQLLGNSQNEKFQFKTTFGDHTRIKHTQFIQDMFPQVLQQVNEWLNEFDYQVDAIYDNSPTCKGRKKESHFTLIFHSNPKIFQFLRIPIYSALYCDSKEVLRKHVEQRHVGQPPGWVDIRLDWFFQCNVQSGVALDNVPDDLTKDLVVCKVSSNNELENTMMWFPEKISCAYFDKKMDINSNLESVTDCIDARSILRNIIMMPCK